MKRGIAGSMVFSVLDRSALHQIIHDGNHMYYRHEYEPATIMQGLTQAASYWDNYSNIFSGSKTGYTTLASGTLAGQGTEATTQGAISGLSNSNTIITAAPNNTIDTVKTVAEYLDQIMPLIQAA